jgi:MinD superfamily P-loop ATPase
MRIAIASGKGGTGKTLVATNLAHVASKTSEVVLYDLDVEEPNCHLFFDSHRGEGEPVEMMIPVVDTGRCASSGVCGDVCEYNAIVNLLAQVLVFPELCHSCYGCLEMCPEGAIAEGFKTIGRTFATQVGSLALVSGELAIGQPSTTPLVGATKRRTRLDTLEPGNAHVAAGIQIYDSPPGTSCPVIEAVRDVDHVVLVSEPTRFGLHDLDLMVQTLGQLEKPFCVVVNKAVDGNQEVEDYCGREGVEVILRIPWRADVAREYAQGRLVAETLPDVRVLFEELLETLRSRSEEVSA